MGRPKKTIDPIIGERIRFIREHYIVPDGEKRITRERLAEIYDVSPQAIAYWENGKREVPKRVIEDFSKTFGIDIDFILGKSDVIDRTKLLERCDKFIVDIDSLREDLRIIRRIEEAFYCDLLENLTPSEVSKLISYIKKAKKRKEVNK